MRVLSHAATRGARAEAWRVHTYRGGDEKAFEPVPPQPPANEAERLRSAQASLWAEYMPNAKRVDVDGLPTHLARLDALDVNYRK